MGFPAPPPDLRIVSLTAGASWFPAHSPRGDTPHIRFLFVGPRVCYPLLSAPASRPDGSRRFFALRFAMVPAVWFLEDFPLLSIAHAGHTGRCGSAAPAPLRKIRRGARGGPSAA